MKNLAESGAVVALPDRTEQQSSADSPINQTTAEVVPMPGMTAVEIVKAIGFDALSEDQLREFASVKGTVELADRLGTISDPKLRQAAAKIVLESFADPASRSEFSQSTIDYIERLAATPEAAMSRETVLDAFRTFMRDDGSRNGFRELLQSLLDAGITAIAVRPGVAEPAVSLTDLLQRLQAGELPASVGQSDIDYALQTIRYIEQQGSVVADSEIVVQTSEELGSITSEGVDGKAFDSGSVVLSTEESNTINTQSGEVESEPGFVAGESLTVHKELIADLQEHLLHELAQLVRNPFTRADVLAVLEQSGVDELPPSVVGKGPAYLQPIIDILRDPNKPLPRSSSNAELQMVLYTLGELEAQASPAEKTVEELAPSESSTALPRQAEVVPEVPLEIVPVHRNNGRLDAGQQGMRLRQLGNALDEAGAHSSSGVFRILNDLNNRLIEENGGYTAFREAVVESQRFMSPAEIAQSNRVLNQLARTMRLIQ